MSGTSSSGKRRATNPKQKPAQKAPKSFGRRVLGFFKWATLFGLVLALVGVAVVVFAYQRTEIPNPNKDFQTQTSFVYYDDGKKEVGHFAEQNRESIPLSEMPDTLTDAVVSAEDRSFWTNKGIDPKGILRAAFSNAQGGSTQGASTITQQYVKILYLSQERTYKRKAKEALLSLKLQGSVSKDEILEGYLNTIYFGRGAYGVQAAAQAYFDKDAADLDLRESAVIASVINNPTQFDPANGKDNREALKDRYEYTLDGMVDLGYVTEAKAEKAKKRLPKLPDVKAENSLGGQKGHMLQLVENELKQLGYSEEEIRGGGLKVTTTFDPKVMKAAEEGVAEQRPDGFNDKDLHVAVASVEPGTGALRGFYGGQDFVDSQLNWAVQGGMVGSTMKPFTLAAGLEQGYSLKDTFQGNSPFEVGGVTVENQGEGEGSDFGEAITPITAMEHSVNTAFVQMTEDMDDGPQAIYDAARAAGIPPAKAAKRYPGIPSTSNADFNPDNFLLTLGNSVVSPINVANAYATIANNGERADVHVIDKVVTADGKVDYQAPETTSEAFGEDSSDVAADVSYTLQKTATEGSATPATAIGRPVAAKTGTATNDSGDVSSAWFAGYTPQLSTAVMYTRGKGSEALDGWLPSYYGSGYPGATWAAVMERAMDGDPVEDFPEPAWLDGEAPSDGHAPLPTYTPKPTPTQEPEKQKAKPEKQKKPEKEIKTPSPTPTPTPTPSPTAPPATTPPGDDDDSGWPMPGDEQTSEPSSPTSPSSSSSSSSSSLDGR